MTFNWIDYLNLAENSYNFACNDSSCTIKEAYYRNSISRAYYSVYCEVRNYVKDRDKVEFSSGAHQKLQSYLMEQGGKKSTIGNQLKQLHQDRIQADYYDKLNSPNKKAGKALSQARKISTSLNDLKN